MRRVFTTGQEFSWLTALLLSGIAALGAQGLAGEPQVQIAQIGRDKGRLNRKPVDPGAEKKKHSNTLITMELLAVGDGVGLKAQEWMKVIGNMDVTVTVRTGRAAEKL